jgi:alpha-D-ribose 1-methylphosphonate 5-triphosphate synthase subunit PhnH
MSLLSRGFQDPVQDAQTTFRQVLMAMSRPGVVQTLDNDITLTGFPPAAYALLLTLADAQTPVWLDQPYNTENARVNLTFHYGCKVTPDQEEAVFALLEADTDFNACSLGTERYPDISCTVIIVLPELTGGVEVFWQGPGIETQIKTTLPLPDAFWLARSEINDFPRGLDFLFVAGNQIVALPRSTKVQLIEEEVACMSQ